MHKQKKGFTLIEILVAIVAIAVLATVAAPFISHLWEKGIDGEAYSMIGAIRITEDLYYRGNSAYLQIPATVPPAAGSGTGDWAPLGIDNPNSFDKNEFWYYVEAYTVGAAQYYRIFALRKDPNDRDTTFKKIYEIKYDSQTKEFTKA